MKDDAAKQLEIFARQFAQPLQLPVSSPFQKIAVASMCDLPTEQLVPEQMRTGGLERRRADSPEMLGLCAHFGRSGF
ncbi:hypothetical protein [Roseibium aggregatum]|uniref:Uncharacterized protein n=1 Tax=Roseibium aggregatum TaxID=187304 RepID=A0A926S7U2_9HYPH|nr:hypothetical protein [Roseibium aggregatum]MBD1548680.1 hypothetical protein [Roseibium aggregatum]